MKTALIKPLLIGLAAGFATAALSEESVVVQPHAAKQFARLPSDLAFPEGITANPETGEIFVGTFGARNALLRYSRSGRLEARKNIDPPLLDLAYNPVDDKVYFVNFIESSIQRIAADFDSDSPIETVALLSLT